MNPKPGYWWARWVRFTRNSSGAPRIVEVKVIPNGRAFVQSDVYGDRTYAWLDEVEKEWEFLAPIPDHQTLLDRELMLKAIWNKWGVSEYPIANIPHEAWCWYTKTLPLMAFVVAGPWKDGPVIDEKVREAMKKSLEES